MERISAQLRELLVLQAQSQMAVRQASLETPINAATAMASVRNAYQQLQELRNAIVEEITPLQPSFRFYHCIIYRELIVQALRQRVVRFEQLLQLSQQTILQKTIRSGGDNDLAARMIDCQAEQFGGRIQAILDQICYPLGTIDGHDLIGREE